MAYPENYLFCSIAAAALADTVGFWYGDGIAEETTNALSKAIIHTWWEQSSIAITYTCQTVGDEAGRRALRHVEETGFPMRATKPAPRRLFPHEAGDYAGISVGLKVTYGVMWTAIRKALLLSPELRKRLAWSLAVHAHKAFSEEPLYRELIVWVSMETARNLRRVTQAA